jgi:hypothetical protein
VIENTTNSKGNDQQDQRVQIHVSPDLDYLYRDVANIYVGSGEVVLEFGNHHRAMPGNVTIANRLVLTINTAMELQQQLQKVLAETQKIMEQNLKQHLQEQQKAS